MPAGDGTGPRGMGPMTGRGAGFCAGYDTPGYVNPVPGRGFGAWGAGGGAYGGGRGRRNMYYATGQPGWVRFGGYPPMPNAPQPYGTQPYTPQMTPEQEVDYLKDQAQYFQDALEDIKKRMSELEGKK